MTKLAKICVSKLPATWLALAGSTFAAVVFAAGCAASNAETHDAGRWQPYSGCNESQCRGWNSGCQAECMNKKGADADVCMNQCRTHYDQCTQSCNG